MKKVIAIIGIITLIGGPLFAEDRAMKWLNLPVGAANIAGSYEGFNTFWNIGANISTQPLVETSFNPSEIRKHLFFTVTLPVSPNINFATFCNGIAMPARLGLTENGELQDISGNIDYAAGIGLTMKISNSFSIGFNVKYAEEKVAYQHVRGTIFDTGMFFHSNNFFIALALNNFGKNLKVYPENFYISAPQLKRADLGIRFFESVLLTFNAESDENTRVGTGIDLRLMKNIHIRGGVKLSEEKGRYSVFSTSVGLGLTSGNLTFNYVMQIRKDISITEDFFSVTLKL